MSLHVFWSEISLNQFITDCVSRHWFRLDFFLIALLILSSIFLLTKPTSDLAGLISLHLGLLIKSSFMIFQGDKSFIGAGCFNRSSIFRGLTIAFASLLTALTETSIVFL